MREDTIGALKKDRRENSQYPQHDPEHVGRGSGKCVAIARTAPFPFETHHGRTSPTAALGVQETAQVENIVRTLKEQGEPLILISHNMRPVMDLVDRIVVFRRGVSWPTSTSDETERAGRGGLHHRGEDAGRIRCGGCLP